MWKPYLFSSLDKLSSLAQRLTGHSFRIKWSQQSKFYRPGKLSKDLDHWGLMNEDPCGLLQRLVLVDSENKAIYKGKSYYKNASISPWTLVTCKWYHYVLKTVCFFHKQQRKTGTREFILTLTTSDHLEAYAQWIYRCFNQALFSLISTY